MPSRSIKRSYMTLENTNRNQGYFSGQRKRSKLKKNNQNKMYSTVINNKVNNYSQSDENSSLIEEATHSSLSSLSSRVPFTSMVGVQLRFLTPFDLPEVKELCKEWFPIDYPDSWYNDITSNSKFYSVACVYENKIIGLVVAEIKDYFKLPKEDSNILAMTFRSGTKIGYILSLGVVKDYRKNGVASLMLENLISHFTCRENSNVRAVYLHVLSTNFQAIRFYEHRGFRPHVFLPLYYNINGKRRDGFTYVLYVNDGHPPWGIFDYILHCCQMVMLYNPLSLTRSAMRKANFVWLRFMTPRLRRIATQSTTAVFS